MNNAVWQYFTFGTFTRPLMPRIKKRTKLISLRRSCIHIFCCFDCAFTRASNICQIYSFCRFLPFFIICPARIMTILAILNHRIDLYFDMPKIILLNMNKHRQILKKLHFIDISRQFRGENWWPNDRCASDRWLCRVFNTCICFQSSLKGILKRLSLEKLPVCEVVFEQA